MPRFQFSLRSLFGAMTLVAVISGIIQVLGAERALVFFGWVWICWTIVVFTIGLVEVVACGADLLQRSPAHPEVAAGFRHGLYMLMLSVLLLGAPLFLVSVAS